MPNKCVGPNCPTNSENKLLPKGQKISVFHFPDENDIELRRKWINATPLKNFQPTKNTVLCAKHFIETDFKLKSSDTNSTRSKIKSLDQLQRRLLKEDAVPSQWPGNDEKLSKRIPTPRPTTLSTSAAREEREVLRNEVRCAITTRILEERKSIADDEEKARNSFHTIDELTQKLVLPDFVHQVTEKGCMIVFALDHEESMKIKFSLKIHPTMDYELWCRGSH